MFEIIERMLKLMLNEDIINSGVIPWASPVASFGNAQTARIATVGINPSDKEFLSNGRIELSEDRRRFPTLVSLNLNSWSEAKSSDIEDILNSCNDYFRKNPYDNWFRPLNKIISGTTFSYYDSMFSAAHLDLVPFATEQKWSFLTKTQKQTLIEKSVGTLADIINASDIEILILNGRSVIERFKENSNTSFTKKYEPEWDLRRSDSPDIKGVGYTGICSKIHNTSLSRSIFVIGYNHNIQSSFGVTSEAKIAIQDWITKEAEGILG